MKIDYISDLHMDFYLKSNSNIKAIHRFAMSLIPSEPGDVIILAGDISHYNSHINNLTLVLKDFYKEVIFVFGNHEMYLISENQRKKYNWDSKNRIIELTEILLKNDVKFLNGDVVEIEGVRFGGTAGWYNLKDDTNYKRWLKISNDSKLIVHNNDQSNFIKRYQKSNFRTPNWNTLEFYDSQYRNLTKISQEKCDILITHIPQMVPDKSYMLPEFRYDPNNAFYYVDNFDLIKKSGCKYYIFGHVHNNFSFEKEGVKMRCNPFGYPGEKTHATTKTIIL